MVVLESLFAETNYIIVLVVIHLQANLFKHCFLSFFRLSRTKGFQTTLCAICGS